MIQRGGVIHERKYFLLSFEFQQDVIEHEATEEFIQTWITMWSAKWESNPYVLRRRVLSTLRITIPAFADILLRLLESNQCNLSKWRERVTN